MTNPDPDAFQFEPCTRTNTVACLTAATVSGEIVSWALVCGAQKTIPSRAMGRRRITDLENWIRKNIDETVSHRPCQHSSCSRRSFLTLPSGAVLHFARLTQINSLSFRA